MAETNRSVRVLIGTVGGQGGGLLCDWFIRGLLHAGWNAQSIGLLGLSQRAGSVIYYVEAAPEAQVAPLFSSYAVPGDVDLVLSQEFLELGRILQGGFAKDSCTIVANTYRYLGTLEKMPAEGGIYPTGVIKRAAEELAADSYLFHAQDLVVEAGLSHLSSNAALLGATVASKSFNLPKEPFERAIRESEVSVADNLKAFALGYDGMRNGTLPQSQFRETPVLDWEQITADREKKLSRRDASGYRSLLHEAQSRLPTALNRTLAEALYRLIDFQHLAYARAYVDRVVAMLETEKKAGSSDETFPLTAAYGRWLAEWLTYEDGPRVAQLKTRKSRFAQIRREHGVKPGDHYLVEDFLAPDPPQLYGMLPVPLAHLVRNLGHRWRADFDSLSIPMRVATSRVSGYYTMRLTAGMRRFRLGSYRHQQELILVERWESTVKRWAGESVALGTLAAEAARVIKGYGHVRDKALADLWTFLDEGLPLLKTLGERGGDVSAAGETALATIAGEAGKGGAGISFLQGELAKSSGDD